MLRNIKKSDNIFLFQLENSPIGKIARQNFVLLPLNQINDEIKSYLSQKNKKNFIQIIEIEHKNIGVIELHNINNVKKSAEIGIIVADEFQNKGIGSAAMILFLDKIYNMFKIKKIQAKVNCENNISTNFFKKNNFVVEEKNENFYTLARNL